MISQSLIICPSIPKDDLDHFQELLKVYSVEGLQKLLPVPENLTGSTLFYDHPEHRTFSYAGLSDEEVLSRLRTMERHRSGDYRPGALLDSRHREAVNRVGLSLLLCYFHELEHLFEMDRRKPSARSYFNVIFGYKLPIGNSPRKLCKAMERQGKGNKEIAEAILDHFQKKLL